MITLNICLSDIPKEQISKPDNGKSYINVTVVKRKEADKFGNTHTIYISQNKEQREAKEPKTYIGSGKEYLFEVQTSNDQCAVDDLPF